MDGSLRIHVKCPNCGDELLVWGETQMRGMATTFVCIKKGCKFRWTYGAATRIHALERFLAEFPQKQG